MMLLKKHASLEVSIHTVSVQQETTPVPANRRAYHHTKTYPFLTKRKFTQYNLFYRSEIFFLNGEKKDLLIEEETHVDYNHITEARSWPLRHED